jgi:hypothetical protein
MAYIVEYSIQYSVKINNANFSNPTVANEMLNDPGPAAFSTVLLSTHGVANGITGYLSPALEYLIQVLYDDVMAFFDLVRKIVLIKAICYIIVFAGIYLFIFIQFIGVLNEEIWQTHGIVNMIPTFVLENNLEVREQVWKRTGIK